MRSTSKKEWALDCMKTHGVVLRGRFSHYCPDFDCIPVDETVPEWDVCGCQFEGKKKAKKGRSFEPGQGDRAEGQSRVGRGLDTLAGMRRLTYSRTNNKPSSRK